MKVFKVVGSWYMDSHNTIHHVRADTMMGAIVIATQNRVTNIKSCEEVGLLIEDLYGSKKE